MSLPKITALVAGVAQDMPVAAVSTTANAGTAHPLRDEGIALAASGNHGDELLIGLILAESDQPAATGDGHNRWR